MTNYKTVINALKSLLSDETDAVVKINAPDPEDISANGLIIIRDGDPGEGDRVIGGRVTYHQPSIEIEVFYQHEDNHTLETNFDALVQDIGSALEGNLTLSGVIEGMEYSLPDSGSEPVEGGKNIKFGVIDMVVDYQSATPLA
jgi:hypothetical protein